MLDPYPTFTPLASFSNVASIFRIAAPDADQVQSFGNDCYPEVDLGSGLPELNC